MYEDSIKAIVHGGTEDSFDLQYEWAKWKIVGDKALDFDEHPDFIIRPNKDGTFSYFATDDTELSDIQAACTAAGIRLNVAVSVELTATQKQYVMDAGIARREQLDSVLTRAARIESATTLDELKAELLTMPVRGT